MNRDVTAAKQLRPRTVSGTTAIARSGMSKHDDTEKMAEALESAARAYGRHSGPDSNHHERSVFGRDLRIAALQFARAYYAEARELGLIPEYETAAINAPAKGGR